ncbi:hypothetical protein B0H14DRAFT_2560310 [Mycena olivaceomarginata]|nr:hypothetical protein B0H14DRAFT_2560310 [Mycena olivaceomarginata]
MNIVPIAHCTTRSKRKTITSTPLKTTQTARNAPLDRQRRTLDLRYISTSSTPMKEHEPQLSGWKLEVVRNLWIEYTLTGKKWGKQHVPAHLIPPVSPPRDPIPVTSRTPIPPPGPSLQPRTPAPHTALQLTRSALSKRKRSSTSPPPPTYFLGSSSLRPFGGDISSKAVSQNISLDIHRNKHFEYELVRTGCLAVEENTAENQTNILPNIADSRSALVALDADSHQITQQVRAKEQEDKETKSSYARHVRHYEEYRLTTSNAAGDPAAGRAAIPAHPITVAEAVWMRKTR